MLLTRTGRWSSRRNSKKNKKLPNTIIELHIGWSSPSFFIRAFWRSQSALRMSILNPITDDETVCISRKRYRELLEAEIQAMPYLGKRTFLGNTSARTHFVVFPLEQRLEISDETKTNLEKIKCMKHTKRDVPETVVEKTTQSITLPSPTFPVKSDGRVVRKRFGRRVKFADFPDAGWNGVIYRIKTVKQGFFLRFWLLFWLLFFFLFRRFTFKTHHFKWWISFGASDACS